MNGLVDIDFISSSYIWSNNRAILDEISERLDGVFTNQQ